MATLSLQQLTYLHQPIFLSQKSNFCYALNRRSRRRKKNFFLLSISDYCNAVHCRRCDHHHHYTSTIPPLLLLPLFVQRFPFLVEITARMCDSIFGPSKKNKFCRPQQKGTTHFSTHIFSPINILIRIFIYAKNRSLLLPQMYTYLPVLIKQLCETLEMRIRSGNVFFLSSSMICHF